MGLCDSTTMADKAYGDGIAKGIGLKETRLAQRPLLREIGNKRSRGAYTLTGGRGIPCGDTEVIPSQGMGILFGRVAGIIVTISLDELLPTSRPMAKGTTAFSGSWQGCL